MNNLRCSHCHQLQFKWKLDCGIITIQIKCYACNHFTDFIVDLKSALDTESKDITTLQNNQNVDILTN